MISDDFIIEVANKGTDAFMSDMAKGIQTEAYDKMRNEVYEVLLADGREGNKIIAHGLGDVVASSERVALERKTFKSLSDILEKYGLR